MQVDAPPRVQVDAPLRLQIDAPPRLQFDLLPGIKYFTKSDLDHLIDTLKQHYDVAVDKEAKELVKIELDW